MLSIKKHGDDIIVEMSKEELIEMFSGSYRNFKKQLRKLKKAIKEGKDEQRN